MKTLCLFPLALLMLCSIGYKHTAAFTITQEKSTEDILIDKIFKLPEVRELDRNINTKKSSKTRVYIHTDNVPTKEWPYYNFVVGYDTPDRWEARYHFQIRERDVLKANFERYLEVMETLSGNYVSLYKYRSIKY